MGTPHLRLTTVQPQHVHATGSTARLVRLSVDAVTGAGVSRATLAAARGRLGTGDRWSRTNYRGETVSLLAGPAYVLGAAASIAIAPVPSRVRAAAIVATTVAGGVGLLDDLRGTGADRGLRGHLRALRRGRVTTGAVKVGGLAAAGLVAARMLGHRGVDALASGVVVAGAANLVNLLDLRPGRALKVGLAHLPSVLVVSAPGTTMLAGPLGAAAGLLPGDLGERTMLGDAGANALGAAIGVAAISSYGRVGRLAHVVGLVGLTLASERVSFTSVIEQTPPLRWLDGLGRRQ